jgi:hypothetical protein
MPKFTYWYNKEKKSEYNRNYQRQYQAKKKLEREKLEMKNAFMNTYKTMMYINEELFNMNKLLIQMEAEYLENEKNKNT